MVINRTGRAIRGRNWAYSNTSFAVGDSPAVHNVNQDLRINGSDGYIACDGAGDILIEVSDNGVDYGTQFTLKVNEVFNLINLDVNLIRITHGGTDSAYRVVVV